MRVLAVETATARGSVAIVDAEGVVAEQIAHVPGGHLEWLVPAIEGALREAGLTREAIDGLAVSIGPGGFSGLRTGVATAAAWAHALSRPLIAISTLEIIAAGVDGEGLVLPALDARRGEIVAALFRRAGRLERMTSDLLLPPDALRGQLGPLDAPVILAGDALEHHRDALLAALAPWATVAPADAWWPRAATAARLGRHRLLAGERHDPIGLVPVYIRRFIAREFGARESRAGDFPAAPAE